MLPTRSVHPGRRCSGGKRQKHLLLLWAAAVAILCCCAVSLPASVATDEYRFSYLPRPLGSRQPGYYEGIRPIPSSAPARLHIISVLAVPVQPKASAGNCAHVQFFLPHGAAPGAVELRIQKEDQKPNYVLDRVVSPPWQSGLNVFTWKATDVLQPLGIPLKSLGVLVYRRQSKPGFPYLLQPALLYESACENDRAPSTRVDSYQFVVKASESSRLRLCVFPDSGPRKPVSDGSPLEIPMKQPFPITWQCRNQPDGYYSAVFDGISNGTRTRLHEEVVLYHKAVLSAG